MATSTTKLAQPVRYELAQCADGDPEMRARDGGLFVLHSDYVTEIESLHKSVLDSAHRRAEYWKAEHIAANQEIERLRMAERLNVETVAKLQQERDELRIKYANMFSALNSKQAKIDALMLEFCPGEMSAEQRAEWARNQGLSQPPATSLCSRTALDAFMAKYWPQLELRERTQSETSDTDIQKSTVSPRESLGEFWAVLDKNGRLRDVHKLTHGQFDVLLFNQKGPHADSNAANHDGRVARVEVRLSETKSQPPNDDLCLARNCLGNLVAAVMRDYPLTRTPDIEFALGESRQFLGPPYTDVTKDDIRTLFNKGVGVQKGTRFSFGFETEEEAERAFHYIADLGTVETSRPPSANACSETAHCGCKPGDAFACSKATAGNGCTCDCHEVDGPASLVDALQDVVHTDPGPVRAGASVRSHETGECPNCFDDKTVTMSDGSKRPCELCAAGETEACPDCGMRPAFDGMWHKPGCHSL